MIRLVYISFIFLISPSCKDKQKDDFNFSIKNQVSEIAVEETLKKYISAYDIPYLLKEDVDSILENEEKIKNDKEYRNEFISKARRRRSGIEKLAYIPYNKTRVPFLFKRFLLPNELSSFHKDSLSDFVMLYELYKHRKDTITSVTKYVRFLEDEEIHKLIKGNFKDSASYQELATSRFNKDSIESSTRFHIIKDSLQSIVHPIDSMVPFGPKPLGRLIENNIESIGFHNNGVDSLTDEQTQSRKDIYTIWMYFLKFHPYADADLSEYYEEKLLPPIKTYQFIDLGIEILHDDQIIDPKYLHFQTRISNIGNYEVYYSTTGVDSDNNNCGIHNKEEKNCCFAKEGYNCNSVGYLTLYNRKNQDATIIPAYVLQNTQSYGFQLQFPYIEDSTIHVFEGYSMYDWFVTKDGNITRYLENKSGVKTNANGYKSIGITKACEVQVLKNGEVKVKRIKK